MTLLRIDNHEPSEIVSFLRPAAPTQVEALNSQGYADYLWECYGGSLTQWERKTWLNLFSSLDDIEFQVYNQLVNHPEVETKILIEGVASPEGEKVVTYIRRKGIMVPGFTPRASMTKVYAWLHSIYRMGIEIQYAATPEASATALASFYANDQKATHDTLRRNLKRTDWKPNVQVARLVGAAYNDTNIGVEKAERLIKVYGTFWNVIHASPEDIAMRVDGISVQGAKLFLSRIGNPAII